jgi:hypothetical protein
MKNITTYISRVFTAVPNGIALPQQLQTALAQQEAVLQAQLVAKQVNKAPIIDWKRKRGGC